MSFSVTILGSSSAKPTVGRHHSSQIVNLSEQYYLVDAGEGCQQQMFRYGINILKIRAVFISHLHGDHLFGLFPLLSTLGLYGRKTSLTIYAPAPFGEMLNHHLKYFDTNLSYPVEWVEVDTYRHQKIFENRTLEVWSVPLRHRVPTSGYLFREKDPPLNVEKFKIAKYSLSIAQITAAKRGEDITLDSGEVVQNREITYTPYKGRSYAYLSDTCHFASESKMCSGVDMIYHEATYSHVEAKIAKQRGHSTAEEAARVATDAGAKRLILGHFSTRYKDLTPLLDEAREIFSSTELAEEGRKFEIDKQR
ncbi:MAG: ribonuclease Z [Rikenellaceae bacterium]